jgi:hypothetical protein
MRYRDFLFEYNRDITKKNFGEKLVAALKREFPRDDNWKIISDEGVKRALIDSYIESFENADPTPNKEYVQWMVRKFVDPKNMVKYEDYMGQLPAYLKKFHKLKQRRMLEYPRSDINKYEDVPNFMNVIDEYPDPERQESGKELKGNATEFYEDNDLRIIVPQDQNAACYYGRGTRWCTAATVGKNYFQDYARRGPLYIVIPKRPEYNGEKYQFSFAADQFMDERDRSIDDEIGREIAQKYPQLFKIFNQEIKKNHTGYWMVPKFGQEEVKQIVAELNQYTVDLPNGSHIVFLNDHPDIEGIDGKRAKLAEILVRRNNSTLYDDWEGDMDSFSGEGFPRLLFAVFNKDYTDAVFFNVDINERNIDFRTIENEKKELDPEIENTHKLFLKTMDISKNKAKVFDAFTNRFIPEPLRIEAEEL